MQSVGFGVDQSYPRPTTSGYKRRSFYFYPK